MEQPIPILERPAFFDGQRLTADDLADAQAYERELRRLHSRALHGWGIGLGLVVAGARRDRELRVSAGYALDSLGRELVLDRARTVAVPPVAAGTFALAISYADDDALDAEERAGVCGAAGAVRLVEAPLLRWLSPTAAGDDRLRPGLDLVLAVVTVADCAVDTVSTSARQLLASRLPYVAAGQSPATGTTWRAWPNTGKPIGVATTVSTAEAGFATTPSYQARLAGTRVFRNTHLFDGHVIVADPSPTSFEFRVVMATVNKLKAGPTGAFTVNDIKLDAAVLTALRKALHWHVVWMGVET
jgi:hypothetical protein